MTNFKGRFDWPDAGTITLLGIGLLCVAASIKFVLVDHAADIARYPLLGGLAFIAVFTLFALRAGRFEWQGGTLRGRRVFGGELAVPLADITRVDFDTPTRRKSATLVVHRRTGSPLTFRRVGPWKSAGALWLYSVVGALIPDDAELAGEVSQPRGTITTTRALTLANGKQYGDRGLTVRLGDSTVYLPTSPTVEAASLRLLLTLTIGGFLPGELRLTKAPSLLFVPVAPLVAAILAAPIDDADKLRRLTALADAIGGSTAPATWEGATLQSSGYTARLARAA